MARQGVAALTTATRRQLQVLEALARERLLDVHYRYALELVDHTRRELEPDRAFQIYARLHQIHGAESEQLFQRVLVAIGRRTPPRPFTGDEPDAEPKIEQPQTVLAQIRKRLRGRENRELREWVEFHTGRAETEVLWTHVENAQRLVELVEPFLGVGEAVGIYTERLAISAGRAEIIYYLLLAHMSAGTTPTTPDEVSSASRLTLVSRDSASKAAPAEPPLIGPRRGAGGVGG